jgi:hypothetical protein
MTVQFTEGNARDATGVDPTPHLRVVSKTEARQGVTGHNVRYVLWFGLAGVVVIFTGLWLYYFS